KGLESAVTDWGGARPAETRAVMKVLDKLTAPGSPGVSYGDLDDALKGLTKVRGSSTIRATIDKAAENLLTPAQATARRAADRAYRLAVSKAILPGGTGFLTRGAAGLYGAEQLAQGNYRRGAAGLGIAALGGRSPGQLLAFGKGAVPQLARTAA